MRMVRPSLPGVAGLAGWYTAEVGDDWSFVTPSGGVLMAVALKAMREELGDAGLVPVSATTVFCSPVAAGPLEIRVEVLRRGGAAAQVRAALSSTAVPGPGLEVSATFARDRSGPQVEGASFPEVPMPDEAEDLDDGDPSNPHARWPFFRNLECRLALGDRFWQPGWTAGPARYARWFRYREPQVRDGWLDPLALPPIADTMPAAVLQALGPGPRFSAPSLDLTLHFLEPTRSEWLLVSAYTRRARVGYATAEAEIWSDERRLVGYATQMMMLRSRRPQPEER